MHEIRKTDQFSEWFGDLRDRQARVRIQARIDRLAIGNPGKHRVLTGGVAEMKLDFGPSYRIYYTERAGLLIILLCGGDKSTQSEDIALAIALAAKIKETP